MSINDNKQGHNNHMKAAAAALSLTPNTPTHKVVTILSIEWQALRRQSLLIMPQPQSLTARRIWEGFDKIAADRRGQLAIGPAEAQDILKKIAKDPETAMEDDGLNAAFAAAVSAISFEKTYQPKNNASLAPIIDDIPFAGAKKLVRRVADVLGKKEQPRARISRLDIFGIPRFQEDDGFAARVLSAIDVA